MLDDLVRNTRLGRRNRAGELTVALATTRPWVKKRFAKKALRFTTTFGFALRSAAWSAFRALGASGLVDRF